MGKKVLPKRRQDAEAAPVSSDASLSYNDSATPGSRTRPAGQHWLPREGKLLEPNGAHSPVSPMDDFYRAVVSPGQAGPKLELLSEHARDANESVVRVVIAEDNPTVAEEMRLRLIRLGYEVAAVAASAISAINETRRHTPHVVVISPRLSGDTDGIRAAEEIQQYFGTPVVFLASRCDPFTIERAKTAQPHGFLLEPLTDQGIKTTIDLALLNHGSEQHLRDYALWFVMALRSIGEGVVAVSTVGRIWLLNPVAEALTGWREIDALGKPAEEVLGIADESFTGRPGEVVRKTLTLACQDGTSVPVQCTASPIVADGLEMGKIILLRPAEKERPELSPKSPSRHTGGGWIS
ncbi:MAG: response regulator [Bryobacteraceae bacterium]